MRRVLILTTFYPPYSFGGDGVDMQALALALARRGSDVTVVHDEDAYLALAPGPPPGPHETEPGVEVIRLRSPFGRVGLLLTHQTGHPLLHGPRLRRLCAERRFDTVIFGNVSLIGGPAVFSLCPDAVRVMVALEHWLICPTHVLWRDDQKACDERRCLRCTLRHRRPPQLWRYTNAVARASRHVDLFVARSEFSRRKHRAYGFEPPMEVVPAFAPSPAPVAGVPPRDRPFFLFVGRVEPSKGLADLLPLFRTDRGADLVVAGTGSAEMELRRSTQDFRHVHWTGFVPGQQLAPWYRHAIALVVPSTTYETFGLVAIEALSHGTPVIVRDLGPLPEIARRGGGLVFKTEAELDAAMRTLREQPAVRQHLADEAVQSFRSAWSEEAVVPRFIDLIEKARRDRSAGVGAARSATVVDRRARDFDLSLARLIRLGDLRLAAGIPSSHHAPGASQGPLRHR